jgi:hypothetical protein
MMSGKAHDECNRVHAAEIRVRAALGALHCVTALVGHAVEDLRSRSLACARVALASKPTI